LETDDFILYDSDGIESRTGMKSSGAIVLADAPLTKEKQSGERNEGKRRIENKP
jgi:hypothetical protein